MNLVLCFALVGIPALAYLFIRRRRPKSVQRSWEAVLAKGPEDGFLRFLIGDLGLGGLWFRKEAGEILLERSSDLKNLICIMGNMPSMSQIALEKLLQSDPKQKDLLQVFREVPWLRELVWQHLKVMPLYDDTLLEAINLGTKKIRIEAGNMLLKNPHTSNYNRFKVMFKVRQLRL